MTADVFFINGIPLFIYFCRNITSVAVRYLEDRKSITIFKYLKEIYMYYLKYGFQVTTLHVDGEFATLQALIQDMTGVLRVNPASASEHIPGIEIQIRV